MKVKALTGNGGHVLGAGLSPWHLSDLISGSSCTLSPGVRPAMAGPRTLLLWKALWKEIPLLSACPHHEVGWTLSTRDHSRLILFPPLFKDMTEMWKRTCFSLAAFEVIENNFFHGLLGSVQGEWRLCGFTGRGMQLKSLSNG